MTRWLGFLLFVIRTQWYLKSTVSLGARVKSPWFLRMEKFCRIQSGCIIDAPGPHELFLGDQLRMNRGVYVGTFAPLRIGDRTDINRSASIDAKGPTTIGRDVWLDANAVIAAGAVVHEGVPATKKNTGNRPCAATAALHAN